MFEIIEIPGLFTFFLQMFPLAYAVMSEKTQSLYQLVLDRILHVLRTVPGEGVGIIRMVSDYEFAILNAMEHAFPGGHSRGCWFHFGQVSCHCCISKNL